ncbi:hypothetical protein KAR91_50600 [Candidatus Pacearchaeota archaeon]|nr:hypothetical protein [Candidatus Pacearchaeota archaeon]
MTERRCNKCEWWQNYEGDDTDEKFCFRFPPREDDMKLPDHCWCAEFQRKLTDVIDFAGVKTLTMVEAETMAINAALKATCGHRIEAARILEIGARTLYRKIVQYGLNKIDYRKISEQS